MKALYKIFLYIAILVTIFVTLLFIPVRQTYALTCSKEFPPDYGPPPPGVTLSGLSAEEEAEYPANWKLHVVHEDGTEEDFPRATGLGMLAAARRSAYTQALLKGQDPFFLPTAWDFLQQEIGQGIPQTGPLAQSLAEYIRQGGMTDAEFGSNAGNPRLDTNQYEMAELQETDATYMPRWFVALPQDFKQKVIAARHEMRTIELSTRFQRSKDKARQILDEEFGPVPVIPTRTKEQKNAGAVQRTPLEYTSYYKNVQDWLNALPGSRSALNLQGVSIGSVQHWKCLKDWMTALPAGYVTKDSWNFINGFSPPLIYLLRGGAYPGTQAEVAERERLYGSPLAQISGGPVTQYNPLFTPLQGITGTPVPDCPKKPKGDANCDEKIDLLDFELWRRGFVPINDAIVMNGDFNNDSRVDLVDFEIWRSNFNLTGTTPAPTETVTPTPTPLYAGKITFNVEVKNQQGNPVILRHLYRADCDANADKTRVCELNYERSTSASSLFPRDNPKHEFIGAGLELITPGGAKLSLVSVSGSTSNTITTINKCHNKTENHKCFVWNKSTWTKDNRKITITVK